MPFNAEHGVVYGDDARKVPRWARVTFCAWLEGKLNDPDGPYAGPLGITAERQAVVTDNSLKAKEKYSAPESPPVVGIVQGPVDQSASGKKIDGVSHPGTRYNIELALDMGVKDRLPSDDDETKKVQDDSLLASYVTDAVERGFEELNALGLYNSDIEPDLQKQRAGEGRHPHKLKFFSLGLSDWAPE